MLEQNKNYKNENYARRCEWMNQRLDESRKSLQGAGIWLPDLDRDWFVWCCAAVQ
jgi:hypothetical protein